MFRTIPLLAAILLGASAVQASAQVSGGDPAAGQRLAEAHCSECHAIDGKPGADQRADSFLAIAQMSSMTSISLHAFLVTPHPSMPNYRLTPREIDDVIAYVLSLRGR